MRSTLGNEVNKTGKTLKWLGKKWIIRLRPTRGRKVRRSKTGEGMEIRKHSAI